MLKHYFGATRFSIVSPDSGSWRLSRGEGRTDAESYSQKLFAPERMGPRVQIFCELAAPLYQQMAERHAFRHFVYYSPLLPERWRRELEAAAQTYPVLELVPVESDQLDVLERMEGHLARTAGDQQALVFAFRIDDDDLLSADYLDQVEPYLIEAHEGYAVSFASGYAGFFENGGYSLLRRHYQPMSSMGQGAIGRWLPETQSLRIEEIRNHAHTAKMRPAIVDAQRPTCIQTRHLQQDTATEQGHLSSQTEADSAQQQADRLRTALLAKMLRADPVADTELIFTQFPTLEGHYDVQAAAALVEQEEAAAAAKKAAVEEAAAARKAAAAARAAAEREAAQRQAALDARPWRRARRLARRGLRRLTSGRSGR